MNTKKTLDNAWFCGALSAFARTMAFIAVLTLGLSGGVYSHAEEMVHHHDVEAHHSHDHSHNLDSCCESDVSETVHCGANLLTLVELYDLNHPTQPVVLTPVNAALILGISMVLDPPPPRSILI